MKKLLTVFIFISVVLSSSIVFCHTYNATFTLHETTGQEIVNKIGDPTYSTKLNDVTYSYEWISLISLDLGGGSGEMVKYDNVYNIKIIMPDGSVKTYNNLKRLILRLYFGFLYEIDGEYAD